MPTSIKLVKRGPKFWSTEDRRFTVHADSWKGHRTYEVFYQSLSIGSAFALVSAKKKIARFLDSCRTS